MTETASCVCFQGGWVVHQRPCVREGGWVTNSRVRALVVELAKAERYGLWEGFAMEVGGLIPIAMLLSTVTRGWGGSSHVVYGW